MRPTVRANLTSLLRQLRENRKATAADRRNLRKVMDSGDMQDEFARRVREKFGINVDNLRALLELFVEYAPQLLKIIMEVIAMFSSRGTAAVREETAAEKGFRLGRHTKDVRRKGGR